jgi:phosphoribosylaminoimidazolecarboxamide formyltransferase/IMP cyclohydrolase
MKPTALFSLHDTRDAARYACTLVELGWSILASQETVDLLESERIPVTNIAEYTGVSAGYGFPPTLHPRVEYALTMDDPHDRIDLVYVISYPRTMGNDVGGRTLLALAAKGGRLPVMSREDMERVVSALQTGQPLSSDLHRELIEKTNAEIAAHYLELASEVSTGAYAGMAGRHQYDLANGENPYQQAAFYGVNTPDPLALARFENLGETPPCQTNLADTDSVINTICLAAEAFRLRDGRQPYLVVGAKHGNPCGMALSWDDPAAAVERALFGNPLAVWGGELVTNFDIDETLAELLVRHPRREELMGSAGWMLDVVIAPDYTPTAVERLLKRRLRKVYRNPELRQPHLPSDPYSYRWVRGGFIRQSPAWRALRFGELEFAGTEKRNVPPEKSDLEGMILAWAVAYTSFHGGNEVALVKDGALQGVGGGPSTVQAAQVAVERAHQAGHNTEGSIFCADAFFPFTDATQVLIDAGVKLGCVPAGGTNEPLVRTQLAAAGVQMYYLPEDFRGFCRH